MNVKILPINAVSLAQPPADWDFDLRHFDFGGVVHPTAVDDPASPPGAVYVRCAIAQLFKSPLSLSRAQLKPLARSHALIDLRPDTKPVLTDALMSHVCTVECPGSNSIYLFTPAGRIRSTRPSLVDPQAEPRDYAASLEQRKRQATDKRKEQQRKRRRAQELEAQERILLESADPHPNPHHCQRHLVNDQAEVLSPPTQTCLDEVYDEFLDVHQNNERWVYGHCLSCAERVLQTDGVYEPRDSFTSSVTAALQDEYLPPDKQPHPNSYDFQEWNEALRSSWHQEGRQWRFR